jgi:hypothetical protein
VAHAIGCLGESTATAVYRRERAKAEQRKRAKTALTRGPSSLRNQNRKKVLAIVWREDGRGKAVATRQGHLRHVKAAFFHAARVEYLKV